MQEIIDWLSGIEKRAWTLYETVSKAFSYDHDLSDLLKSLAEDEQHHYNAIANLKSSYIGTESEEPLISIDKDIVDDVIRPFQELESALNGRGLTVFELMDTVITLEFSELNGIFLYAVESIRKTSGKDFARVAMNMEEHKNKIKRFIASRPELAALAQRANDIPRALSEGILIVGDNRINVILLKSILEKEALVDTTNSVSEAIKKIGSRYYSAVVTEVDMPHMNGIEFYNEVVARYPRLKNRFIFIINSNDYSMISFFKKNNLLHLTKPAPVSDIRKNITNVLHHSSFSSNNG